MNVHHLSDDSRDFTQGMLSRHAVLMENHAIGQEQATHLAPLAKMISNHSLADCSRYASYIYARAPALVSTALATLSFAYTQP